MAQTSLAASMPPDPFLSSIFLVNLRSLVERISLPPKLPETTVHISQSAEDSVDDSDPVLCPADPPREPIPQMALEEHRRDLDELLEETEGEIEALMEFWESCFVDETEDSSPEIPWIIKWPLGRQPDLNDECLWEDPSYNKEQVEQEALEDYLKEQEEQRAPAAVEQAASQKRDAANSSGLEDKAPASLGKHTAYAKALAGLSQGRPPTHKEPCGVILSIAGEAEATREEAWEESGSPSSSSEEEEAANLLRKTPKRNLRCRASGTDKTHTGKPRDRSEQLQCCKQKVSRHRRHNSQRPVRDQSSEKPETSSSGKGQPSKPYNFRHQTKQVSYVSQQEEEEEEERSWSEGSSEKDWLPGEEGSDAEEEENTEEVEEDEEDEEVEREEEAEAKARPAEDEPQRKNRPKTVRSYRCPECDREFSNSSNMQKHLLVHRGERPYGCHVCGKSFAHPSNLTKHQMVHVGERCHPCPTCPKAFYVKNHLDAHMRRHQGIRPFPCLECPSTFCSRVDLLYHMKIHVEGKGSHRRQPPVRCTDCNKTFPGLKLLRRHQKRHKKLVCEDCGEVFDLKHKYKFHRSLHVSRTCGQCGVNYTGTHLCQGPAQNSEQPKRATRKSSASVPQGVKAKQPVGTAAPAGRQKQLVGSTRAATRSSGTDGPSVSPASRLSSDGPVRPSDPACRMSLREPSPLAQTDAATSQRNMPLIPVTRPVLDHRRAKSSTPAQTPLQLKPAGIPGQGVPVILPVASSPATIVHTPPLPGPPGMITLLPRSQTSIDFPVLAAASPTSVPLTGSQPEPLTVRVPVGLPRPSGSNPVSGAANNGFILLNPTTLPASSKIILEIPGQKIVPSITAQICAVCQAKYVGTHRCRKLPQDPGSQEETSQGQLVNMTQTPLATSMPPDPHCEPIPQMAAEEHRRDLDELLEETEREIEALVEFWESCFVDETEDSSPEIPWIMALGTPLDLNDECLREDPSYNEERVEQEALEDYLKELEEQRAPAAVKQAARQKRDAATSGGVEGKAPALPGKLTVCAKALASLSQGRPPSRKKPYGVILSVTGEAEATREEAWEESGSPSSSSEEEEEEEATVLLRKMPKRNLQCRASGTGKTHTGKPLDRSEQLRQRKQKESRHRHRNPQQPAAEILTAEMNIPMPGHPDAQDTAAPQASAEVLTNPRQYISEDVDQSSEKSETSSSGKGQPLKPYNFRPQRKQVSYVSPQEEEEEEEEEERSWSEGSSSEKDWLPEEEEDTEEEEDIEEMEEKEDEEAEREEESEADAGPSVSTSSQFSTDGQVRPSDPLYITSLKEPSHPAWTDGGTSQRNRPLIPVTCPAPHHRKAKPLTPAETPLQLTPTGILLQDVPVISPVTLSPAVAKPVAHTPALPRPPGQATVLPHSQTSVDFPVLTTAPPMSAPLTDSHPEPLTVTIAVGPPEPSGSNPVGGAANNGFILLNPATLPTGTKIILEIPGQKIVPFITAQICAICQAKYVGTHRCRNSPQDPAERSEEEEPRTCQLGAEESTTILWQASPFHPPCPQFHEEREPSIKSHSLYQASSQATYAHGDGEESESDTEEDCEVKGSEEVKLPVANERLSLPVENWQELRQTKQGQSHYVCNLCNKRFVQHYAFENHMHMHSFLRSELLKWQKLHNRKETTA